MINGEYRHTLDSKNRTFLPAKLREALGENIVIARGIGKDKCISVYPMDAWTQFVAKIDTLPAIQARTVRRWVYGLSQDAAIDSQGRTVIPAKFAEYAGLKKNIVSLGVGDHIEIWDEEEYDSMISNIDGVAIEETLINWGM